MGFFAHPRYRREGLGPASSDVTDFVDYRYEASPSIRSGWKWVGWEKVGEIGGLEGEETGIGM